MPRSMVLAAALLGMTARLEQEPVPLLRRVEEYFEQRRRPDIAMLIGEFMYIAKIHHHRFVVFHEFAQHVVRRDEIPVVIRDTLESRDVTDRAQRRAADLPHPLGQLIG